LPKLLVDIGPLRRFPQYRRVWIGYTISALGSQLTIVAVAFQVFAITHSSFDVGLVSLIQLVPAIFAPMVGGAIADAIDRRKVLVYTAIAMTLCPIGLALNALGGHPALWPLFLIPAVSWIFSGISGPTSTAVQMTLVDRESLVAANVLRLIIQRLATVVGPTLGGVLIATGGVRLCYWLDAVSFFAAIGAVAFLQPLPHAGGVTKFGWTSIKEGFAFLRGRQVIQACFIADFNATVLGLPTSLFPAMAYSHFGATNAKQAAVIYGLLVAAPGFGGLVGSLVSGWTIEIRRQGRAVLLSITLWGFALASFGIVRILPIALVFLAIAGWSDLVSASFRNTILQFETPDRLRGRLSALSTTVVSSGPRLGNFEAGAVAAVSNTEWSVVSGGLGCVLAMLLLAKFMPRFGSYQMGRCNETTVIDEHPQPGPGGQPRPAGG
jgi:MFS family permease